MTGIYLTHAQRQKEKGEDGERFSTDLALLFFLFGLSCNPLYYCFSFFFFFFSYFLSLCLGWQHGFCFACTVCIVLFDPGLFGGGLCLSSFVCLFAWLYDYGIPSAGVVMEKRCGGLLPIINPPREERLRYYKTQDIGFDMEFREARTWNELIRCLPCRADIHQVPHILDRSPTLNVGIINSIVFVLW
ncbi:hypothetical protein B0T22DRAFT_446768 [Podospora appendiculata]|uniref:Uncharacterized protein n=1 Tax=Podospora appendiculata TaxID=314037 RepID=A0AAE0XEZ5_9PEZI|nr:hypothetical protein B0T22DRAFT_446768 [Podospora appendiculata]